MTEVTPDRADSRAVTSERISELAMPQSGRADTPQKWALVIATYCRRTELLACVRLALAQTRPPCEIVVIDGSPDWQETRKEFEGILAREAPGIVRVFEQAATLSIPAQRNQGILRATADILFMIDDDTYMQPDCAQRVMELYDADVSREVVAISLSEQSTMPEGARQLLPGRSGESTPGAKVPASRWTRLRGGVRERLSAWEKPVPYPCAREYPVPDGLAGKAVAYRGWIRGAYLTERREVALAEPFAQFLMRYASGEDWDQTSRAGRHGCMLEAFEARCHHLGASSGRLPMSALSATTAGNMAAMHALYSPDRRRSSRLVRREVWRRLLLGLLADISAGRIRLPKSRGVLCVLRHLPTLGRLSREEIPSWYHRFQLEVLSKWAANS